VIALSDFMSWAKGHDSGSWLGIGMVEIPAVWHSQTTRRPSCVPLTFHRQQVARRSIPAWTVTEPPSTGELGCAGRECQ